MDTPITPRTIPSGNKIRYGSVGFAVIFHRARIGRRGRLKLRLSLLIISSDSSDTRRHHLPILRQFEERCVSFSVISMMSLLKVSADTLHISRLDLASGVHAGPAKGGCHERTRGSTECTDSTLGDA
jgi:hypothetical protein